MDGMAPFVRRVAQLVALSDVQVTVLLGCAGTLDWPAAWLYLGLYVVTLVVAALVLIPQRWQWETESGPVARGVGVALFVAGSSTDGRPRTVVWHHDGSWP